MCERFGVPFWVGEKDVPPAENPKLIGERQPDHFMAQLFAKHMTGPAHHVDRHLREGDEVASFKVIDVPGHSAGHVAFWRESDGVLVLGDVLNSADVYTLHPRPSRAQDLLHPRPRREPPLGAQARPPRAQARPLRPRPARSRHEEVRRLRERPAGLATQAASAAFAASHWRPTASSVSRTSHGFDPSAGMKSSAIPRAYTGHIRSSISSPSPVSCTWNERRSPGHVTRSTNPAFSIRSSSRLIPLLESSTRSASSTWRIRMSGASRSAARTSYQGRGGSSASSRSALIRRSIDECARRNARQVASWSSGIFTAIAITRTL